MELYQDQKQKLNELWGALAQHNRILFQAQTGAGKTVMASSLINALVARGQKVAFIVDREELVNQSYATFAKNNVSIVKAGQDKDFDANKPIQIVMIQTYHARRDKLPDMELTHVIIDECHNNFGTGRINEFLRIYSDAKVIGLTATPADNRGWLMQGFDHYIEGLQAKELIKLGRLCPTVDYVFESYGLQLDGVSIVNGDYDTKEIDEQVLDVSKVEKIIDEWERLANDRKTLVFGNSIKHATALHSEFIKRGHAFELLHSQNNNRGCIERLKAGTIQGIVNVSITIAGFDCPSVSCIVNARPTKIERIARQLLGRGRRVAKDKENNLHLDFANYVANFGCTDDDRFYVARPPKNDEPLFVQCAECGHIQETYKKVCEICGYDLSIEIERGNGSKVSKKQLERLVKMMSMQDEMYNRLKELVKLRGYKYGYAFYLYRDLLKNGSKQGTGLTFYKKMLNRIDKCRNGKTSNGKEFKLQWLKYQ